MQQPVSNAGYTALRAVPIALKTRQDDSGNFRTDARLKHGGIVHERLLLPGFRTHAGIAGIRG